MSLRLSILVVLVASHVSSAQSPTGPGTPGTGGAVPVLTCDQAWMGNANFGLQIDNCVGGGSAYVVLASAGDDTILGGIPIYFATSTIIDTELIFLGGAPGVAGAGSAFFPIPLTFPVIPAIAGVDIFAQVIALDFPSGLPAVSNGLRFDLTMPPGVFVSTSVGGNSDPYAVVEPLAGAVTATGSGPTDNANGVVFADFGTKLFATSFQPSRIIEADMTGATPVWSTLVSFPAGSGDQLGHDPLNKLLWTVADPGTGTLELVAIDIDDASASYGSIVANTNGVSGLIGRWALSPDGRFAAVPAVLGSTLQIFDTDPNSPTFTQLVSFSSMPTSAASSLWISPAVGFGPDSRDLFVLRTGVANTPVEVSRYSFDLGAWVDHDPTTPQIDNFGQFANPPVVLGGGGTCMRVSLRRNRVVLCGLGGNGGVPWVGVATYDPVVPSIYGYASLPAGTVTGTSACGVNADGTMFAVRQDIGGRTAIVTYDAQTLATVSTAYPSGIGSVSEIVWR